MPTLRQDRPQDVACAETIGSIGYFFQITQLPNLDSVSIVASDFGDAQDTTHNAFETIENLNRSIGYAVDNPRSVDRVRVSDAALGLCFAPGSHAGGSLSNLTIADASIIAIEPLITIQNYLDIFKPLFDFTTLNVLELEQTLSQTLCEGAWAFFGSLANLRSIAFQSAPVGGFLDTFEGKPEPPLPHNPMAPYFPALSTLRFSSLELDEEEYGFDGQELVGRLIKILRRRVKRGFPLSELYMEDFGHLRESDVSRLQRAVPSLRIAWDGYTSDTSDWESDESSTR